MEHFILVPLLTHQNALLVSAANVAIGLLGKSTALPVDNGKAPKHGSPDAKRPANGKITKIGVANQLLENMKNAKLPSKLRERAAKSLGLICVGEEFPYTKEVIQGFLDTAKEVRLINNFQLNLSNFIIKRIIYTVIVLQATCINPIKISVSD